MSLSVSPGIESPCKLICKLQLGSGLCEGCGRSREEIARWTRYTDSERAEIMKSLDVRLESLDLNDDAKE